MYPRLKIGGHEFSTYWALFLVGVIFMFEFNLIRGKKRRRKISETVVFTVLVILFSLLGAKILYYMENITVFWQQGIRLNGVSFFGAVFLVPVGIWLICRITGKSFEERMDFLSPCLMLMLAVLRIGCFFSGCCGGISVTLGGFYFSEFPTQLTEAAGDLLIMAGLLIYEHFWKKEGRLYFFIMVYYGCLRFILEFVRDTAKDWLFLSHGQWFSILSICIGGYFLHKMGKHEKKKTVRRQTAKRKRHK